MKSNTWKSRLYHLLKYIRTSLNLNVSAISTWELIRGLNLNDYSLNGKLHSLIDN